MTKVKHKKPVEPMNLDEFAEAKYPSVEGLALHIDQSAEETLNQELRHWCENIEKKDPDLSRTHTGIHGLLAGNGKRKTFARLWIKSVLKAVLHPNIPEDASGHPVRIWHLMDRLKEWKGEEKNPVGMKTPKGRHLMALAFLGFSEMDDHPPFCLRDVVKAVNHPSYKSVAKRETNPSELIRELFPPKPPDMNLKLICSIVAPWEADLERGKPERERLELEIASLVKWIGCLEQRVSEARAETATMREELASSRAQTAERETVIANLHGEITQRIHDEDRFQGAVNQLLTRKLLHSLKIALDAANAQDPGIRAIKVILNNAIEDIEAFNN